MLLNKVFPLYSLARFAADDGGGGGDGGTNDPSATGDAGAASDKKESNEHAPVPYLRFAEVNKRANEAVARLAEIETAQTKAEEEQLKADKEWQKLAESKDAELAAVKQEKLRLEVAANKGLPVELAARLQGSTVEEMTTDADFLLTLTKASTGAGHTPVSKKQKSNKVDLETLTPAEIRKKSKGKAVRDVIK